RRRLVERLGEQAEAPRRDLREQRGEARVVAQRRAVRDARAARDAAEREGLEPVAGEQLLGDGDQALGEGSGGLALCCGGHGDSVYQEVDACTSRDGPARALDGSRRGVSNAGRRSSPWRIPHPRASSTTTPASPNA